MELISSQNTIVINVENIPNFSNVYILQKIENSEEDFSNLEHYISNSGAMFILPEDGYYKVHRLLITTIPNDGYYINGSIVYAPGGEEIESDEIYKLLEIENYLGENIEYINQDYFNYFYVEKMYIDLLKNKLLMNSCGCSCKDLGDKVTIDTLTMGMEVIKYLVYYTQYYEANRVVKLLTTCAGVITTNCNCHA